MKNNGYTILQVIKALNRNDEQQTTSKVRARKLSKYLSSKSQCVLLDDETYLKMDFSQLPGTGYYVQKIRGRVLNKFWTVGYDKFAKITLIWQGICPCGLETKFFVTSLNLTSDLT
jgi:hypothetical protein